MSEIDTIKSLLYIAFRNDRLSASNATDTIIRMIPGCSESIKEIISEDCNYIIGHSYAYEDYAVENAQRILAELW
jgi:hypothetical protein